MLLTALLSPGPRGTMDRGPRLSGLRCQVKGSSPPCLPHSGSCPPLTGYSWRTSISAGRTVMVGQRPGPSLALVQKCCWLELAQSCCRVHLARRDPGQDPGQDPRGLLSCSSLPGPAPAPAPPLPGASPCLQGAPATVGIGRTHAVPTGGVHGARSDFHSHHLEAEAGAWLSEAAHPSQGTRPARARRGGGNRGSALSRG